MNTYRYCALYEGMYIYVSVCVGVGVQLSLCKFMTVHVHMHIWMPNDGASQNVCELSDVCKGLYVRIVWRLILASSLGPVRVHRCLCL